jgi:hypothetical protein
MFLSNGLQFRTSLLRTSTLTALVTVASIAFGQNEAALDGKHWRRRRRRLHAVGRRHLVEVEEWLAYERRSRFQIQLSVLNYSYGRVRNAELSGCRLHRETFRSRLRRRLFRRCQK